MPLAVQCVPDRVLSMVLEYSEDVYIGCMENSAIKLRESSRHKSSVPCVNWWRVVRESSDSPLVIQPAKVPVERCALRRVRVVDIWAGKTSVTFADDCGLLSNTYINASLNMSIRREPGNTMWIWNQQHVAVFDDRHHGAPEIRHIPGLYTFHSVVAVNRKYLFATRDQSHYDHILMQVFGQTEGRVFCLEPPHAPGSSLIRLDTDPTWPRIGILLFAVSFVDAYSPDVLVVEHDLSVRSHGSGGPTANLLGRLLPETPPPNPLLKTHSWNCTLLYQEQAAHEYVLCFCAKMLAGNFFFHMIRFTTHPTLTVTTMWKSHPDLSCRSFELHGAARTDAHIDIAPPSSSLIIYQSPEVLVGFDRKTLCGSKRAIRLPYAGKSVSSELYAPFEVGYSRVKYKTMAWPALAVVVDGIRRAKEKRRQRQQQLLGVV